ncbi:MAG: Holliday junction resolvase RuvX, partial [Candidatus Sungbacteria bacterium]|nr:Holliday junction resolvase RuvX [Candidatus Sungbacteria bacterium]
MRYMGIDYGAKRIGLALSDEQGFIAFPYAAVENLDDICAVIKKERVGAV